MLYTITGIACIRKTFSVLCLILFLILSLIPLAAFGNEQPTPSNVGGRENIKQVDKALLNEFGITDDDIIALGDNVDVVEQLIKSKQVTTKEYAKNLKEAFLHPAYTEVKTFPVINGLAQTDTVNIPVTGVKNEVELIKNGVNSANLTASKKNKNTVTIAAATCPTTLDGYHYIVRSKWDRNKATGNITFPWGIAVTNWDGKQNEVPYLFFGIYNSDPAKGGADAGLYFDNTYKKWYPFFNGWNQTEGYVWKSVDKTTYAGIDNATKVHLVVTEKDNAIEVKVIDRSNWTEISTTLFSVSSYFGFNSSGTNTRFNKETSLAAHCYNGTSGAYIKGAYWSNAHIYWTTGYNIWDTTQTVKREWKPDMAKVTQFDNVIQDYQDQISIEFK
jgi:hypothetical protein